MVSEIRLAVGAVAKIAVEAAREASPDITIAGVMPGEGGTSYTEILVNVEGWDEDSRQITLGVFRNARPATLKKEIYDHLQRRLHERSAC